ncbi:transcriptional regulator [Morganella morganii]
MNGKNSEAVSLNATSKETLKDRLITLIGDRSVRSAAKDWSMSVSTLNNYLKRGTEPALNVINHIAKIEQVSLDWLANGYDQEKTTPDNSATIYAHTSTSPLKDKWLMILESIDTTDAEALIRAIHRKGVEGLLNKESHTTIEDMIDSLNIRATLKQAIKEAAKGDETLDQEILRRIEEKKNTDNAGQLNQEESHQKVG